MRREQLYHAIRTACTIINRSEVTVLGSQSALISLTSRAARRLGGGNAPNAESRDRLRPHHTRMCPQSQATTSTFWLDVVGSWWLKVPEGVSVVLGVRTPKGG